MLHILEHTLALERSDRLSGMPRRCGLRRSLRSASAKADRLHLTRACQANLSQIFGIFPDPSNEAQEKLEAAIQGVAPLANLVVDFGKLLIRRSAIDMCLE